MPVHAGHYAFFFLALWLSTTLCSRMKKHSIPPVVILCHQGALSPLETTIFLMVVRVIVPKKVPITFPTPPVRSVTPIMWDAMEYIYIKAAMVAFAAKVCIMNTNPEIPLRSPLIT